MNFGKFLKELKDKPVNLLIFIAILVIIIFFVYPFIKKMFVEGMDNMEDTPTMDDLNEMLDQEYDEEDDDEDEEEEQEDDDDLEGVPSEGFTGLEGFKWGGGNTETMGRMGNRIKKKRFFGRGFGKGFPKKTIGSRMKLKMKQRAQKTAEQKAKEDNFARYR
jgi:hypothetical protein